MKVARAWWRTRRHPVRPLRSSLTRALSSHVPPDPRPATGEQPRELLHVIRQHIKAHGPLPLSRYMSLCLGHPTLGYYTRTREGGSDTVFGKAGDFITSPEISQVFGELIAVWFIAQWQAQGMPAKTRIVELGPGRGTLMQDMLRSFTRIKTFASSLISVDLVETSPYMRQMQEHRLRPALQSHQGTLRWHDALSLVPSDDDDCFTMLIAHEFFDALPIQLFVRKESGWREIMVDTSSTSDQAALAFAVSPGPGLASELYTKQPRYAMLTSPGVRAEVCADGYTVAEQIGHLIAGSKAGGAGLVIDYGDDRVFGNSFRAFREHRLVDPLEAPGQADLTANVDFGWLKSALDSAAQTSPLLSQHDFLVALGLQIRKERLLEKAAPDRRKDLASAIDRLADPTTMGREYKVLAVVPKGAEQPYPFLHGSTAT